VDKYYWGTYGNYIITQSGAAVQVGNTNKDPAVINNMVPIHTWRDNIVGTTILYDRNTHTVYKSSGKYLSKLSGEHLDKVRKFGRICSIGNILFTQEGWLPTGFRIPEAMADDIHAMYLLPIKNTTIYGLYGKDRVTLFKRKGIAEIKNRLKEIKDKETKITVWDVKPIHSDKLVKYSIDTNNTATQTIKDFINTEFTTDNSATFVTMSYDTFNQAFFPKQKLPTGAELLYPEEYSKFKHIETNTNILPFKKDNSYYVLTATDQIIQIGNDPSKVNGIYGYKPDNSNKLLIKVESDKALLYRADNHTPNDKASEPELFREFKQIKGFGIGDNNNFLIEDTNGVLHTYKYMYNDLDEVNTDPFFIKAAALKNTLSQSLTLEAAQQYLSVICQ